MWGGHLVALAVGYIMATVLESLYHDVLQHAPRSSLVARRFVRVVHTDVHHHRTYRASHVQQWTGPEERARVDAWVEAQHGASMAAAVRHDDYGLAWNASFALTVAAVMLPPYALLLPLLGAVGTGVAALPALAVAACSTYVHTYLHRPLSALRTAPLWTRLFLSSWYGRQLYVSHFLHHRNWRSNFNFFLLGGDWLRGTWRRPSADETREMKRIGII